MSDDLVNQLTLNFLISKQQLQKLNKKTKETAEQQKIKEIQEYKDRIKLLFNDLLVYQPPEDLLFEVKVAFENFIEKSIYYLKAHDNSEALEIERSEEIHDDIDFEIARLPDDELIHKELQIKYKSSTEDHYCDMTDKKQ
jgi:hypothetical protein